MVNPINNSMTILESLDVRSKDRLSKVKLVEQTESIELFHNDP